MPYTDSRLTLSVMWRTQQKDESSLIPFFLVLSSIGMLRTTPRNHTGSTGVTNANGDGLRVTKTKMRFGAITMMGPLVQNLRCLYLRERWMVGRSPGCA